MFAYGLGNTYADYHSRLINAEILLHALALESDAKSVTDSLQKEVVIESHQAQQELGRCEPGI